MQNTTPAAGAAMPALPESYARNWDKARELAKQLAKVLEELETDEFVHVRSARNQFAVVFGGTPYPAGPDPLLVAIDAYKAASAIFNSADHEDMQQANGSASEALDPALDVLLSWSKPARSREAVVAALELINAEKLIACGFGVNLLNACIPFIKGEMI